MNKFQTGDIYMGRLNKDDDLYQELSRLAVENQIKTGIINVIGAVSRARIGFYNQEKRKYEYIDFDHEMEIAGCRGNISILDGKPMVHAHITLAEDDGTVYGGHLTEGTIVFASEVFIQELKGDSLIRSFDQDTDLTLW